MEYIIDFLYYLTLMFFYLAIGLGTADVYRESAFSDGSETEWSEVALWPFLYGGIGIIVMKDKWENRKRG